MMSVHWLVRAAMWAVVGYMIGRDMVANQPGYVQVEGRWMCDFCGKEEGPCARCETVDF